LLVDYTRSIIMTSVEYVQAMEAKAARKEALQHQKDQRREEAECTWGKRVDEKKQAEMLKVEKREERATRKAFNDRWSLAAVTKAGEELHRTIKSRAPPPPGSYTSKFVWFCPPICRCNQAVVIARRRARKAGEVPDPCLRTIPPWWVHQDDARFAVEVNDDNA
jgi:hypothetical protein